MTNPTTNHFGGFVRIFYVDSNGNEEEWDHSQEANVEIDAGQNRTLFIPITGTTRFELGTGNYSFGWQNWVKLSEKTASVDVLPDQPIFPSSNLTASQKYGGKEVRISEFFGTEDYTNAVFDIADVAWIIAQSLYGISCAAGPTGPTADCNQTGSLHDLMPETSITDPVQIAELHSASTHLFLSSQETDGNRYRMKLEDDLTTADFNVGDTAYEFHPYYDRARLVLKLPPGVSVYDPGDSDFSTRSDDGFTYLYWSDVMIDKVLHTDEPLPSIVHEVGVESTTLNGNVDVDAVATFDVGPFENNTFASGFPIINYQKWQQDPGSVFWFAFTAKHATTPCCFIGGKTLTFTQSPEEHISLSRVSYGFSVPQGYGWSATAVGANSDAGFTGAETYLIFRFFNESGRQTAFIREPATGTFRISRGGNYAFPTLSVPTGTATALPVGNDKVRVELWWDDNVPLVGGQKLQDLQYLSVNVTGPLIEYDKTPPVTTAQVQGASGLNGWYVSNAKVALTSQDDDSGVSVTLYSIDNETWNTYSSPIPLPEGRNTVFYMSLDNSGNLESINSLNVPIDTTPPTISGSGTPSSNAYGWNNAPVRVHFDCADNLSGLASCTPDVVIPSEGRNQSVFGTAEDLAGNSAHTSLGDINIDMTSPNSAGCTVSPPINQNGWHNTDVTVECTFKDDLSGIPDDTVCVQVIGVVCPGPIVHTIIGTEGRDQSVTLCTYDRAGNKSCATVGGINIDKTPPVIESPQDGQVFFLRQTLLANAACADSLSGIDTCVVPTFVDTTTVGAHSYIVTSTDLAGNPATLTVPYKVHYVFVAISPKPPNNRFQVGGTIPVRFQLKDALGNFVSTATAQIWVDSPTSPGKCSGSSNTGHYFRYDSTDNQYLFNLSTKGMTIGQHTIFVTLDDGTTHTMPLSLSSS